MIISRSFLLRIRNFAARFIEEIKTPILLFFENLVVYEIMWKKYCRAGQATDDMADPHYMLIRKATNTHSEYVIVIAFPLQQWLHERSSIRGVFKKRPKICYKNFNAHFTTF